jgi:hypothetical protein
MFLPEEIWLIIFKYLEYYDINNLVILREKFPALIVDDMEHIKKIHYTLYFKKYKIVNNLLYTYQNIKTINSSREYMKIYTRNFYTKYDDYSTSKIISLKLNGYLCNKITDSKNKKKFKNLTKKMKIITEDILLRDIIKFKYKEELEFFLNNCITK